MKKKKTFNITLVILAGLMLGIVFGLFMPGRYEFALPVVELITNLYMNALKMMIYPMVFCSLVAGIQGIGSVSATGRVGGQSLLYYGTTTLFASPWACSFPRCWALVRASPSRCRNLPWRLPISAVWRIPSKT